MSLVRRVAARYLQSKIPLGKTVENGAVRIHRYRDHFRVTDLTNAGKRGKQVMEATVQPSSSYRGDSEKWMDSISSSIESYDTYGEVLALFRDLLVDYPGEITVNETRVKGVDVEPGGLSGIALKTTPQENGSYLEITSKPTDWAVKSVAIHVGPKGNSFAQDTLYYPFGGKRDIAKGAAIFNKWLQENLSKANKMNIGDLIDLWRSLGVKYDSH